MITQATIVVSRCVLALGLLAATAAGPAPAGAQPELSGPPELTLEDQKAARDRLRQQSLSRTRLRFDGALPRSVMARVPLPAPLAADPVARALYFVDEYRALYRLTAPREQLYLRRLVTGSDGSRHVFFRQRAGEIPVFGAGLAVHLDGDFVTGTVGRYLDKIPEFGKPRLGKREAEAVALKALPQGAHVLGETRLVYWNAALLGLGQGETRLAWRVSLRGLRSDGAATLWSYLVDAHDGRVLLGLDTLRTGDRDGEDFDIESAYHTDDEYCWIGSIDDENWFDEDGERTAYPGASGDAYLDGRHAYEEAHRTYHYFYDTFNRRSWAGDGDLAAMVHVGNPWRNAAYSGGCDLIKFGDGYVTRDVFAHEFTHGVNAHAADFEYVTESGALDESYSDVFGYLVDPDDWLHGEDVAYRGEAGDSGGDGVAEAAPQCGNGSDDDGDGLADEGCPESCFDGLDNDGDGFTDRDDTNCFTRDLSDPPRKNDPDHMSGFLSLPAGTLPVCDPNAANYNDCGYVHSNSGILNKVFYLLVEGGTHGGETVAGIGRTKAARLYYDVARSRLDSTSQFEEARDETVLQARAYADAGSYDFGVSDACAVIRAFAAVGLGLGDLDCDGWDDLEDEDLDGDGALDYPDNCDEEFNPGQEDADADGRGDACDDDMDGDGVANGQDNCPLAANQDQADTNGNGFGDACEDRDGDNVVDAEDNCVEVRNYRRAVWTDVNGALQDGQPDYDLDGVGDACDDDIDGDGRPEDGDASGEAGDNPCTGGAMTGCDDNCPERPNRAQEDRDGDRIGDACDGCPESAGAIESDIDRDGLWDACDPDIDGDGVPNGDDNCPYMANPDQSSFRMQGAACLPEDEYIRLLEGPRPIDLLLLFGLPRAGVEIPFVFDPCAASDCPDYLAENFGAVLSLSSSTPVVARVVDDRGRLVSGHRSDTTLAFRFQGDHYYRAPVLEPGPPQGLSLRAAASNAGEQGVYRGTRYFLEVFPRDPSQVGREIPLTVTLHRDRDGDEVPDVADNCPGISNPDQTDRDRDAVGDACDPLIELRVFVDLKPGSCPNPLNPKSSGVVPAAILGTAVYRAEEIDPASVFVDGTGLKALRLAYEDVGRPFEGPAGGCLAGAGDGLRDLTLKFDAEALSRALDLALRRGEAVSFTLRGRLRDGTPFVGQDRAIVVGKAKGR